MTENRIIQAIKDWWNEKATLRLSIDIKNVVIANLENDIKEHKRSLKDVLDVNESLQNEVRKYRYDIVEISENIIKEREAHKKALQAERIKNTLLEVQLKKH